MIRILKLAGFWLGLTFLYVALTFVVSSIQVGPDIKIKAPIRLDLIAHAIEYGILAWLCLKYFKLANHFKARWTASWLTVLIIALVGGLNELYQSSVPGRTVGIDDEVFNILGAIITIAWQSKNNKVSK